MSYINFKLLHSKGLEPEDIYFLTGIKQLEKDVLEKLPAEVFNRLEGLNLLTNIKGKKGDNPIYNVRLSKGGVKLVNDLSFEGSVDEESEVIGNWLINLYKSRSGGIIKNKTEIKRRIQWYKTITGISGNRLGAMLGCFIQDTYNEADGLTVREFMEQNPRGVLSNMCDNICWNPPNNFARHYTLADSPLHKYFEDNQECIEKVWESKGL